MFSRGRLGGLTLAGKSDELYRECVSSMIVLRKPPHQPSLLSRRTAERLLQTAILRSLQLHNGQVNRDEPREQFQRRRDRQIQQLRRQLLVEPKTWTIQVPVGGLHLQPSSQVFGAVTFSKGTASAIKAMTQKAIPDMRSDKGKVSEKNLRAENERRAQSRLKVAKFFQKKAIATLTVQAYDSEAASEIGIERIGSTVDIINFFAQLFTHGVHSVRAYIPPDMGRPDLHWLAFSEEAANFHACAKSADDNAVRMIEPDSEIGRRLGMQRAGEMLRARELTDFQRRVLSSLAWAGRASAAMRRDESFLFFAIALETLLTKTGSRTGVTDRLRLRAARLIGLAPDTRKRVLKMVDRAYERRSELVHTGDTSELTESDWEALRELAQRALTGILTDERFSFMRQAQEFEEWFEKELLD